mmetsp:Transcript_7845/g.14889  ORF Transcript_7845/g.14889 Transcript_7845/m.14889 type:complete len:201 (+) Transcript_7845:734-1336(+)
MHKRVVGCSPVPKASPGSSLILTAVGATGSSHEGTTHTPGATSACTNESFTFCTQSTSTTPRTWRWGWGMPRALAAAATDWCTSTVAGKSAVTTLSSHAGLSIHFQSSSPGSRYTNARSPTKLPAMNTSCSRSVPLFASSTEHDTAPSPMRQSEKSPAFVPSIFICTDISFVGSSSSPINDEAEMASTPSWASTSFAWLP